MGGKGAKKGGNSSKSQPQGKGGKTSRRLLGAGRVLGCIQEWSAEGHGWIVPLQAVSHPQAKRHGGRIHVELADVHGCEPPEIGANVDFALFSDARGLGAVDVRLAPGDEEEGPEVPRGDDWKRVWSEEHKRHYLWNKVTKESSWETAAASPEEPPQAALPAAWEKHFDEERQETYYWNKHTKESSWTVPGGAEPAAEGEDGAKAPARRGSPAEPARPEGRAAAEGAPVLAQTRVKGHLTKWQGFCGWITPDAPLGEDFGPQDKVYVNWREMPKGADLKVGTEVDFLVVADEHGYGAADVQLAEDGNSKGGDVQQEVAKAIPAKGKGKGRRGKGKAGKDGSAVDAVVRLERQWSKQDKQLGIAPAGRAGQKRKAAEDEEEGADEGVLLPGWEQIWSAEHSCNFYWHTATKQSSWDRPCMPTDDDDDDDDDVAGDGAQPKVWEGEGSQQGASYMATPMTPMVNATQGRSMTPLTPKTMDGAPTGGKRIVGRHGHLPPPPPPIMPGRAAPRGGARRRVA